MKQRISLTLDPEVVRRARQLAHQRHTSVSQLVEEELNRITQHPTKRSVDFVEKWAGKFKLTPCDNSHPRREYLWKKYGLADHADTD